MQIEKNRNTSRGEHSSTAQQSDAMCQHNQLTPRKGGAYARVTYGHAVLANCETHPIERFTASPLSPAKRIKTRVLATDQSVGPVFLKFSPKQPELLQNHSNHGPTLQPVCCLPSLKNLSKSRKLSIGQFRSTIHCSKLENHQSSLVSQNHSELQNFLKESTYWSVQPEKHWLGLVSQKSTGT